MQAFNSESFERLSQSFYGSKADRFGFSAPRPAPSKVIYARAAAPPVHTKMRLAPNPGQPRLRSPGSTYKQRNFSRPCLTSVKGIDKLPLRVLTSAVKMPDNFCWQPQDLTETRDQGSCGSCWAQSFASMIGDRVSAQTNGKVRTAVSVVQIMECSEYPSGINPIGCDGNVLETVVNSLGSKNVQFVQEHDYPREYASKNTDTKDCILTPSATKYYVTVSNPFLISQSGDSNIPANIENMKQHIYNEGPIVAGIEVYNDFMNYDGLTIYEPGADKGDMIGGHAIEVVGWGMDPSSNTGYWVCRNSWGTAWPAKHKKCAGVGFFFVKMGSNVCGIESLCLGVVPTPHNANKSKKDKGNLYPGESACEDTPNHDIRTIGGGKVSLRTLGLIAGVFIIAGTIYYVYKKKNQKK